MGREVAQLFWSFVVGVQSLGLINLGLRFVYMYPIGPIAAPFGEHLIGF